ncbi:MAG: preprotein translocase subunit SecA [Candidatus Pacebacteria bacterium]|nr:preprotein translocase subunit SecA [Candidatus Paceibacterota bacterium]
MKLLKKIFGDENQKKLKEAQKIVETINGLEESIKNLDDSALAEKTNEFKSRLEKGESLDDILPEAFAVIRETAWRTLGQRHYDVQLIGGMMLHWGHIAEMRTGEGKTLVSTLPTYLNALEGKGVHVVTVNDYLARRDAQWMGQVFAFHGLSIGVINDQNQSFLYDAGHQEVDEERDELGSFKVFYEFLKPSSRKSCYEADITYGTNNQFGFDYLRDHTAQNKNTVVQRGHHYVVIDEVDSILIDEARVPLILSTAADNAEGLYTAMNTIAGSMTEGPDYEIDEKLRAVSISDQGIVKAEKALKIKNIYTQENIKLVHHLETALKAKAIFQKDRDYVVQNNEVLIVDQFTGRLQEGRRYSDGLHQALEAKERVPIQQESKTLASITYQNYFKFYEKISGMTGTGKTSEEEFQKVYGLDVYVIPTHRPIARIDQTDLIYQNEEAKFKAIAQKVKEKQDKGQPVLIGTVSVEKNELLSAFLKQAGVKHQALNAKNHESEGEIIAQAGKPGSVVIATNMAGRGVDIKLGGNPCTPEEEQEVKDLGGLFVLGTERHDARRIDDQLRGRAGRQGDVGETQFYVSLDDPIMKIFGGDRIKGIVTSLGLKDDEAIQNKMISRQLENAQEKVEGFHFDGRKAILDYDNVLSYQRDTVYERRQNILMEDPETLKEIESNIMTVSDDFSERISKKKEELTEEQYTNALRQIALYVTDQLWMQHLQVMDYTRQSVNLRAYGQRDPLVEYKKEGLRLYQEMGTMFTNKVAELLAHVEIQKVTNTSESEEKDTPNFSKNDSVQIIKDGEVRQVKKKKLQTYLDAGWQERK